MEHVYSYSHLDFSAGSLAGMRSPLNDVANVTPPNNTPKHHVWNQIQCSTYSEGKAMIVEAEVVYCHKTAVV